MLDIARETETNRRDLFRATSQAMSVNEAIIEKDFWVCWVLNYLFTESPWKDKLIFKGGTSLSKAYGVIERFSEDIDLVLDWSLIGLSEDEAWVKRGRNAQKEFNKQVLNDTSEFIRNTMAINLQSALSDYLGGDISVKANKLDVLIGYPRAFSSGAILPQIRLEIGPRSKSAPNEIRQIMSYAADKFPEKFKLKDVSIPTLAVELTFWEKVMILHKEAHRPRQSTGNVHLSRHYYDLYRLSKSSFLGSSLEQLDLLKNVAELNKRFFYYSWAKDEDALAGRLILVPDETRLNGIANDYKSMQEMLFGDVPTFEKIMEGLLLLEDRINNL